MVTLVVRTREERCLRSRVLSAPLTVALLFSFAFASPALAQWDADAGLIASLTDGAPLSATSTTGGTLPRVIDGDEATQWQSGACYPHGFVSRADANVLLGACADGRCSSSTTTSLDGATLGGSGSVGVQAVAGRAWLRADLAQPDDLYRILVRLGTGSSVTLSAITATATLR